MKLLIYFVYVQSIKNQIMEIAPPRFFHKILQFMCVVLAGVAVLGGTSAVSAETGQTSAPSVLFCSWNTIRYVDFAYYKELERAGFRVDYLDDWKDFSLEKIKGYNAIVLFSFPAWGQQLTDPDGGPNPGWNYEQTLDAVKQYLALGGGVIWDIDAFRPHLPGEAPNTNLAKAVKDALGEFGAKLPYEHFVAPESQVAQNVRLGCRPYIYLNHVEPSSVSEGVTGVWIPDIVDGHGYLYSGPVVVDSHWTPVVRAGKAVVTGPAPHRFEAWSDTHPGGSLPDLFERKEPESDAVFYAIREVGPGRMALFNLKSTFHVGAGTQWFYNRITLDRGLKGKPSGFGRLLQNTLRWAAEPSLENGALGGAAIASDRLVAPAFRAEGRKHGKNPAPIVEDPLSPVTPKRPLFRGFVGARTELSGGSGSVEDYAKAAREAKLDFVVFMEEWSQFDDEKMAQLKAECARLSRDGLLLLPGYSMATNVGPRMMVYGPEVFLPKARPLFSKARPGTFALQAEDETGRYTGKNNSLTFIFELDANNDKKAGNIGFYDFGSSLNDGRFRLPQARAFGCAGVLFYRDGKLVEDLPQEYLETNAGTMSCVPLAVAEVTSPAQMKAHVEAGNALTYAEAGSLATLLREGLKWNHQYMCPPASVSNGPTVQGWPENYQVFVYGCEDFVNERARISPEMLVRSDAGIKEVRIYDGERLFRRFLPDGAKEFSIRLYLSALLQHNLTVEVEDVNGRKNLGFPLRTCKEENIFSHWCADHINEGGSSDRIVKFARGPVWMYQYSPAYIGMPGFTWDGGPPALIELAPFGESSRHLRADEVEEAGPTVQTPFMESIDERVFRGGTRAVGTLLAPGNPWSGWGPIGPLELADSQAVLTIFRQALNGPDPTKGSKGLPVGSAASLFEENNTFNRNANLREFRRTGKSLPGDVPNLRGLFVVGRGDAILGAYNLYRDGNADDGQNLEIPTGGWFATVTAADANTVLAFNRGAPLVFNLSSHSITSEVALPAGGRQVKKGEKLRVELFTVMWPAPNGLGSTSQLLQMVQYLGSPQGLELLQGKRLPSQGGLQECNAQDGAVEIRMPKQAPQLGLPPTELAVRVAGLNPNWTACEYQIEGFAAGGYFSRGGQVFRPLGVDPQGCGYAPLYVSLANVHTLLGHPVVANAAGKDLKIQVTALESPRDGKEGSWHISVNNPTDHPITAQLSRRIDLPGLKWEKTRITLRPGEYRILEHGGAAPAGSYPQAINVAQP